MKSSLISKLLSIACLAASPAAAQSPLDPDAPWLHESFDKHWFDTVPLATKEFFDVNTEDAYEAFNRDYIGRLRQWHAEALTAAEAHGQSYNAIVARRLEEHFQAVRTTLQNQHPTLSDTRLRIAHATNLTHGHYAFGTNPKPESSLRDIVERDVADCSEYACLAAALTALHGIPAKVYSINFDYHTPPLTDPNAPAKRFYAGHQVAAADGLIIDAEINTLFEFELKPPDYLAHMPRGNRLQSLVDQGKVHPSYNWLLSPDQRRKQHDRRVDGGIIVFTYAYYLEGLDPERIEIYNSRSPFPAVYERPACRPQDILSAP